MALRTQRRRRRMRRRRLAAIVAGLSVLGITSASAASLGGLTTPSLGADVGVVASCDTDGLTVSFTNTYSATLGRYQATAVGVGGINAACATKSLNLTLRDATNVSLGTGTIAALTASATQTVTLTAPGVNANSVAGVAVVITG
jgi:hypothetical protein